MHWRNRTFTPLQRIDRSRVSNPPNFSAQIGERSERLLRARCKISQQLRATLKPSCGHGRRQRTKVTDLGEPCPGLEIAARKQETTVRPRQRPKVLMEFKLWPLAPNTQKHLKGWKCCASGIHRLALTKDHLIVALLRVAQQVPCLSQPSHFSQHELLRRFDA